MGPRRPRRRLIAADASAIVNALMREGEARAALEQPAVVVPHAADAEIVASLRSAVARREMTVEKAEKALARWITFGCERFSIRGLLPRMWQLRENVGAYDAAYVALAETLDCELLTSDVRLAQATGPRCRFAIAYD